MNIQDLKDKCNNLYSQAIEELENNGEVKNVRTYLLDCASVLLEIGKNNVSLKVTSEQKAKNLLDVVKKILSKEDYSIAYFTLTGNELIANNKNITAEQPNKPEEKEGYTFKWNEHPSITFDDVAGLNEVKETVKTKVLLPLQHPELFEGYTKKNGGGILLYGPPGTGKTMIAAAIAKEINANFCSIGPSDLLTTGVGNSEKLIAKLFSEARSFKCSVIFFDEFESLCPATTHAQVARQIRSELLKQMQGLDSYGKDNKNILLLIGATNKPWDIDPAFVRPGRLGTRVYVDLPDDKAREYMLNRAISKIKASNKVLVENIDINYIVEKTEGFNGADMSNLIDKVQEISIRRAFETKNKAITQNDFESAINSSTTSVQKEDLEKLEEWKNNNG